jgi:hypothetical protein
MSIPQNSSGDPLPHATIAHLYNGLVDEESSALEYLQLRREVAGALGSMALGAIITIVGTDRGSWMAMCSLLLEVIALPALVFTFVISGQIGYNLPLRYGMWLSAAGVIASLLGFLLFVASYSRWAASLLFFFVIFLALYSIWSFCRIHKEPSDYASAPKMTDPRTHRTKKDRLLWALFQAEQSLHLQPTDYKAPNQLHVADFDGREFRSFHFTSKEIEQKYVEEVVRWLREGARQTSSTR